MDLGSDLAARWIVTESERRRWDRRHCHAGMAQAGEVGPFPLFESFEDLFPTSGSALEIACGRGAGAVWLAERGMTVRAVDLSPSAIQLAKRLAARRDVRDRCRFEVHDLDDGLPAGPAVDLLVCHLFRQPELDQRLIDRVRPGGMLAIGCLSEVDATPGRFRAAPGELSQVFGQLHVLEFGEADGRSWLIARNPDSGSATWTPTP